MGVCTFRCLRVLDTFTVIYGLLWLFSVEIKFMVYIHSGFDEIFLTKVGPIGNKHVKITLDVISMLHIHT